MAFNYRDRSSRSSGTDHGGDFRSRPYAQRCSPAPALASSPRSLAELHSEGTWTSLPARIFFSAASFDNIAPPADVGLP